MTELVVLSDRQPLVPPYQAPEPDAEAEWVLPGGRASVAALLVYMVLVGLGSVVLGAFDARWAVGFHGRLWDPRSSNATAAWTQNVTASPSNATVTAQDLPGPFALYLLYEDAIFLLGCSAMLGWFGLTRYFSPDRLRRLLPDEVFHLCTYGFMLPWIFNLISLGSYDRLTTEDRAWWLEGAPELATWHWCTQVYAGFASLPACIPVLLLLGQLVLRCRECGRRHDVLLRL